MDKEDDHTPSAGEQTGDRATHWSVVEELGDNAEPWRSAFGNAMENVAAQSSLPTRGDAHGAQQRRNRVISTEVSGRMQTMRILSGSDSGTGETLGGSPGLVRILGPS